MSPSKKCESPIAKFKNAQKFRNRRTDSSFILQNVQRTEKCESPIAMKKKQELLKDCANIMRLPHVQNWYVQNLEFKPQADTVTALSSGVSSGKLTVKEALCIALIVGVQWNEKFEGVP